MSQFKLADFVYPKKLPWEDIFQDLHDNGISAYQASILIGERWSSLQRWTKGVEPRHSVGVSLLKLHAIHCGEKQTAKRIHEAAPTL